MMPQYMGAAHGGTTDRHWVPLFYLVAGAGLFHRQVMLEEGFMRQHYGQEYAEYCGRVRRYI
jgi:protein-S-isoprenylcysteine O-methyltransferase Ste14